MRSQIALISYVVIALFTVAAAVPAAAQGTTQGVRMVVPEMVKDFGTVAQGEKVDTAFEIRNEGTATLEIRSVRPTCGCTVAEFDSEIAPGETGSIRATLDTNRFNGPISKSILVLTNDPATTTMTLVMKANVQPFIEVLPRPLIRLNAIQGEEVSEKIVVVSSRLKGFEVTKVTSSVPYLDTSIRKLAETERVEGKTEDQFEITVALNDRAPVGPLNASLTIETDNDRAKRIEVKLFGVVRALVHVTPSEVQFGSVEAAVKPGRNIIVVNNRASEPMQVTAVDIDNPAFAAQMYSIEDGKRYQVTVTVLPDAAKGVQSGSLSITTDDPERPVLTVPITANIR